MGFPIAVKKHGAIAIPSLREWRSQILQFLEVCNGAINLRDWSSIMIDQSQVFNEQDQDQDSAPAPYIRIDITDIDRLLDSNLSAAGIKLFLLGVVLDRYGNNGVKVQTAFLRRRLGSGGKLLSKSTYYEEKSKLQKLGLLDFTETEVRIRNLTGVRAPERISRNSPENRTTEAKTEPTEDYEGFVFPDSETDFPDSSLKNRTRSPENRTPTPLKPLQDGRSRTPIRSNKGLNEVLNKERERGIDPEEISFEEEKTEDHPPVAESIPDPVVTATPTGTTQDQPSAPKNFDYEKFAWETYLNPGDGGSDPGYWDYAYNCVVAYDGRRRARNKQGVADFHAYTLECIRDRKADGYKSYLISLGVIEPDSPDAPPVRGLAYSEWQEKFDEKDQSITDLSDAIACCQANWKRLRLGWADPRWSTWLHHAQAFREFDFPHNGGFYNLPDWAIRKLAFDLEKA